MNRLQAEVLTAAEHLRDELYKSYDVKDARSLARMMTGANAMSLALLDLVESLDNLGDQEHLPEVAQAPSLGLTPLELRTLRSLENNNGVLSVTHLCDKLNSSHHHKKVSEATVLDTATALESDEFVAIKMAHGKRDLVNITKKGSDIVGRLSR